MSSIIKSNRRKAALSDAIFQAVTITIATILFLAVLYPIIYVVSSSFSSPTAIASGKVILWPVDPTFEGYRRTFEYREVWTGFSNSVFYTVVGTALNLVVTILAAYPLSRKRLIGRDVFTFIFAFTMWFSGGLIPSYLLMRSLHMINTRWALLLPGAMSVYNMIITRTFFQTNIPDELLESAKLDGCSDFRFLISIVLPLSKAVIAVIALYYGVSHWNSYFSAFIYLTDRSKFPLQIFLREVLVMSQTAAIMADSGAAIDDAQLAAMQMMSELLKYSLIVISSLPLIMIYPFVQKQFIKGVMIGALKG